MASSKQVMNNLSAFGKKAGDNFLSFGAKVAQQRHLSSLKDGFVTLTGLIIAASIPLIIAIIFFQNNGLIGALPGIKDTDAMVALNKYVAAPLWEVWNVLMQAFSILIVMLISYFLVESYHRGKGIYGSLIGIATFFVFHPLSSKSGLNFIGLDGLILAIFVSLTVGTLYSKLVNVQWLRFNLPASVPPVISKSFANILVYVLTIAPYILLSYSWMWIAEGTNLTGVATSVDANGIVTETRYALTTLFDAIYYGLAAPLRVLGTNIGTTAVIAFLIAFFWFFGIHGTNVMAAVTNVLWLPLANQNLVYWHEWINGGSDLAEQMTIAAQATTGITYTYWNTPLAGMNGLNEVPLQTLAYVGGTGATGGMIIAVMSFVKRKEAEDLRVICKFGAAPAVFGINEPIAFGVPIILNAIYFIPYVLGFTFLMTMSHVWIHLHWMRPMIINSPMLPYGLDSFVATNFDWRALMFAAIHLVFSFFMWWPFVKMAEKQKVQDAEKLAKEAEAEKNKLEAVDKPVVSGKDK